MDQHTLLKEDMNHKTKVNTSSQVEQAENATLASLQFAVMRQHLGDIEDEALTAQTLAGMALEILGDIVVADESTHQALTRLDALFRSAYRNAVMIQESAVTVSLALEDFEGGAQ